MLIKAAANNFFFKQLKVLHTRAKKATRSLQQCAKILMIFKDNYEGKRVLLAPIFPTAAAATKTACNYTHQKKLINLDNALVGSTHMRPLSRVRKIPSCKSYVIFEHTILCLT